MKTKMACAVSCGVCLALLGCASEQRRSAASPRDHLVLRPHPTTEGGLVCWNRGIDPEHLRAALVEPVEVHFVDRHEQDGAEPSYVAAFRWFVNDELTLWGFAEDVAIDQAAAWAASDGAAQAFYGSPPTDRYSVFAISPAGSDR